MLPAEHTSSPRDAWPPKRERGTATAARDVVHLRQEEDPRSKKKKRRQATGVKMSARRFLSAKNDGACTHSEGGRPGGSGRARWLLLLLLMLLRHAALPGAAATPSLAEEQVRARLRLALLFRTFALPVSAGWIRWCLRPPSPFCIPFHFFFCFAIVVFLFIVFCMLPGSDGSRHLAFFVCLLSLHICFLLNSFLFFLFCC